jgi:hypothetical protein
VTPVDAILEGTLVSSDAPPMLDSVVLDPAPPANTWNVPKTAGVNIVDGPYLGGNYWASPAGTGFSERHPDRGDGFCAEPFVIAANNVDSLPLHVPMAAAVQELIDTVMGYHLRRGLENSLVQKLDATYRQLLQLNPGPAGQMLNAFIKEATAQRGKALTGAQSRELVETAQWITSQIASR